MKRVSARKGRQLAMLMLSLWGSVGTAHAQAAGTFVKPGDTVSVPLPVENAADSDDTINSMKVMVTVRFSEHDRHRLGANPATVSDQYPPASRSNVRQCLGPMSATLSG